MFWRLIAAAVLLGAAADAAHAQYGDPGGGLEGRLAAMGRPPIFEERWIVMALSELRNADSDRDGLDLADLERQEAASRAVMRGLRAQIFFSRDLNADGKLDQQEMAQAPNVRSGAPFAGGLDIGKQLRAADRNQDGSVSLDEVLEADIFGKPRDDDPLRSLLALDPDKDGRLTARELRALAEPVFARFDRNGDGMIDDAEMTGLRGYAPRAP